MIYGPKKDMKLTPTLWMRRGTICAAIALALTLGRVDIAQAGDWYLRAALGYEQSADADYSDTDCSSRQPPALFGCAMGGDGRSIGAYGDFGDYPMVELALGTRLLPWLRTDLSLGYRFAIDYQGNANFLAVGTQQPVSAELESWNGMVNVFVDLAALSGTDLGRFQPYVGAGVGVALNQLGRMTYLFPENPKKHKFSLTPEGERTNFAYRLVVGTGIALSERVMLDLSAYYTDLGEVGTDTGIMAMNNIPAGILIDETATDWRAFGVGIGLRYDF